MEVFIAAVVVAGVAVLVMMARGSGSSSGSKDRN